VQLTAMVLRVSGERISRLGPGSEIRVAICLTVFLYVIGGGMLWRIAGEAVLHSLSLVYPDVVDIHFRREF